MDLTTKTFSTKAAAEAAANAVTSGHALIANYDYYEGTTHVTGFFVGSFPNDFGGKLIVTQSDDITDSHIDTIKFTDGYMEGYITIDGTQILVTKSTDIKIPAQWFVDTSDTFSPKVTVKDVHDHTVGEFSIPLSGIEELLPKTLSSGFEKSSNTLEVTLTRGNGTFLKSETDLSDLISDLVEKEAGKGLSTNDFSDAYKTKLDNIEDPLAKSYHDTLVDLESFAGANPPENSYGFVKDDDKWRLYVYKAGSWTDQGIVSGNVTAEEIKTLINGATGVNLMTDEQKEAVDSLKETYQKIEEDKGLSTNDYTNKDQKAVTVEIPNEIAQVRADTEKEVQTLAQKIDAISGSTKFNPDDFSVSDDGTVSGKNSRTVEFLVSGHPFRTHKTFRIDDYLGVRISGDNEDKFNLKLYKNNEIETARMHVWIQSVNSFARNSFSFDRVGQHLSKFLDTTTDNKNDEDTLSEKFSYKNHGNNGKLNERGESVLFRVFIINDNKNFCYEYKFAVRCRITNNWRSEEKYAIDWVERTRWHNVPSFRYLDTDEPVRLLSEELPVIPPINDDVSVPTYDITEVYFTEQDAKLNHPESMVNTQEITLYGAQHNNFKAAIIFNLNTFNYTIVSSCKESTTGWSQHKVLLQDSRLDPELIMWAGMEDLNIPDADQVQGVFIGKLPDSPTVTSMIYFDIARQCKSPSLQWIQSGSYSPDTDLSSQCTGEMLQKIYTNVDGSPRDYSAVVHLLRYVFQESFNYTYIPGAGCYMPPAEFWDNAPSYIENMMAPLFPISLAKLKKETYRKFQASLNDGEDDDEVRVNLPVGTVVEFTTLDGLEMPSNIWPLNGTKITDPEAHPSLYDTIPQQSRDGQLVRGSYYSDKYGQAEGSNLLYLTEPNMPLQNVGVTYNGGNRTLSLSEVTTYGQNKSRFYTNSSSHSHDNNHSDTCTDVKGGSSGSDRVLYNGDGYSRTWNTTSADLQFYTDINLSFKVQPKGTVYIPYQTCYGVIGNNEPLPVPLRPSAINVRWYIVYK